MGERIYGLLGRKLGHSWSAPIHASLGCENYRLIELEPEELASFLAQPDIGGLNVTIPYKRDVMPYCEHLYYGIDLGLNFMGSGKLQVRSKGNLERRDPRTYEWKSIGHDEVEYIVRKEGHNFFKVADDLRVYPVLQLSIGAAF